MLTDHEVTKVEAWLAYLQDGGLDRPIAAVPFELLDQRGARPEVVEFLGWLVVLAVMAGPERASELVGRFLCDPESICPGDPAKLANSPEEAECLRNVDDMLCNAAASMMLMGMWHDGRARPDRPGWTLRKLVLERGEKWDLGS